MSNYLGAANAFLDAQLRADGTLLAAVTHTNGSKTTVSLRGSSLPQPEPGANIYPAIIYANMTAPVTRGNGGARILSTPLYLVKAIAKGGYGNVTDLADRIDAALNGATAEVSVNDIVYSVSCVIEKEHQREDWPQGVLFVERGAFYRLFIQRV